MAAAPPAIAPHDIEPDMMGELGRLAGLVVAERKPVLLVPSLQEDVVPRQYLLAAADHHKAFEVPAMPQDEVRGCIRVIWQAIRRVPNSTEVEIALSHAVASAAILLVCGVPAGTTLTPVTLRVNPGAVQSIEFTGDAKKYESMLPRDAALSHEDVERVLPGMCGTEESAGDTFQVIAIRLCNHLMRLAFTNSPQMRSDGGSRQRGGADGRRELQGSLKQAEVRLQTSILESGAQVIGALRFHLADNHVLTTLPWGLFQAAQVLVGQLYLQQSRIGSLADAEKLLSDSDEYVQRRVLEGQSTVPARGLLFQRPESLDRVAISVPHILASMFIAPQYNGGRHFPAAMAWLGPTASRLATLRDLLDIAKSTGATILGAELAAGASEVQDVLDPQRITPDLLYVELEGSPFYAYDPDKFERLITDIKDFLNLIFSVAIGLRAHELYHGPEGQREGSGSNSPLAIVSSPFLSKIFHYEAVTVEMIRQAVGIIGSKMANALAQRTPAQVMSQRISGEAAHQNLARFRQKFADLAPQGGR